MPLNDQDTLRMNEIRRSMNDYIIANSVQYCNHFINKLIINYLTVHFQLMDIVVSLEIVFQNLSQAVLHFN